MKTKTKSATAKRPCPVGKATFVLSAWPYAERKT